MSELASAPSRPAERRPCRYDRAIVVRAPGEAVVQDVQAADGPALLADLAACRRHVVQAVLTMDDPHFAH